MGKNYNSNAKKNEKGSKNSGKYGKDEFKSKGKFGNRPKDTKGDAKTNGKGVYVNTFAGTENDPTWYNRNKMLLDDVARISFYNQQGREYPLGADDKLNVPTILAFRMATVPGYSDSSTSGLSLATQGVFAYIRKKLSTVASYQAADVGMYILAIDQIYSIYSHIMRLFGTVNLYSARNLSFPKALIKAMTGWSDTAIADFQANINRYRALFNNFIYKASALYLPVDFTLTARHSWLYGSVFTDSRNVKAQLYIHQLWGFYVLNEEKYDTGTALEWTNINNKFIDIPGKDGTVAFSDGMEATLYGWNYMLDTIRNSDSMLKIQSDMERAFDGKDYWNLAMCDEGFCIQLTHSDEVLSQINNMDYNSWLAYAKSATRDITQDVNHNTIIFKPWVSQAAINQHYAGLADKWQDLKCTNDRVLNFHWDSPTPDDIAVATRNINVLRPELDPETDEEGFTCVGMGVDICLNAKMYVQNKDNIYEETLLEVLDYHDYDETGGTIADYVSFDWAPTLCVASSEDTTKPTLFIQDWDNYATVDPDTITNIHRNIIMNMYNIPELGMITG